MYVKVMIGTKLLSLRFYYFVIILRSHIWCIKLPKFLSKLTRNFTSMNLNSRAQLFKANDVS